MPICDGCRKKGKRSDITPFFLPYSQGEVQLLCSACRKAFEASEHDQKKPIKSRCFYCGSPVSEDEGICPFCKKPLKEPLVSPVASKRKPSTTQTDRQNPFSAAQTPVAQEKEVNWDTVKHLSLTIIGSLALIIAFAGVVTVLPGISPSNQQSIYGTWLFDAGEFTGLSSDLSDDVMIWTFNKDETLDIEIKQNAGPDVTAHYLWEIKNGKLYLGVYEVSQYTSYDPKEEFAGFAIESDYLEYMISEDAQELDLTYEDDVFIRLKKTS
jgi:hypothetical protein